MRQLRRGLSVLIAAAVVYAGSLALFAGLGSRPEDLPWTPLDLSAPVGLSTGRKLASLNGDLSACRAALDDAGVRYLVLPPRRDGASCGYADAVRLAPGGARRLSYSPSGVGITCRVAAGLSLWEWDVIQPTARRRFGQTVAAVEHVGSYNCRRISGRNSGTWSEHAAADAIDITGFHLTDGRRITVARDWHGGGQEAAFLRDVRDGACGLFSTVLSPDYNAAHHDHLHLDQAARGATGWRACR